MTFLPAQSGDCFISMLPEEPHRSEHGTFPTVQQLVHEGWGLEKNYTEPRGENVGDMIAFLGSSSGTTGLPKAIAVPHRSVIAVSMQMTAHYKANEKGLSDEDRWIRPGDLVLGVLPFFHVYGLVAILHTLCYSGAGIVVVPQFSLEPCLKTIVTRLITHLPTFPSLVPSIIVLLVNVHNTASKKYDLSHCRWVVSGGAPLSSTLLTQLRARLPGARIGLAYGMTETTGLVCMGDFHKPCPEDSAGYLLPDTMVRIVKADGTTAESCEPGEIWVQGPQNTLGYTNDKKATEETFLPDGWVRTGDEGYVKSDGSVFIIDRLKELIKVRAFQVAPAEREAHLLEHPSVQDTGVIGVPDEYKGEIPLAFVVLDEPTTKRAASSRQEEMKVKQELTKWVSDQKVRYKWLDGGIEFVDSIPKSPSGKILRRLLRDRAKPVLEKKDQKDQRAGEIAKL
ncbi:acetyl-CoA synthetase-like protein [Dacryopinax primogenitus]|uniref:Acetyl-CoA synthetase-like protein n=1 Tax=Dacryopinax primogenitus (strain DJM 731) TaxID=1858805 RepID=M5FNH1_DACPD|nr:acetyl-CoA synthetase-like protein [Dacryopinax primogenitus]EJT97435.1 acetyl-CoA synthetase-like protein [Dacryopinax primogenitus]